MKPLIQRGQKMIQETQLKRFLYHCVCYHFLQFFCTKFQLNTTIGKSAESVAYATNYTDRPCRKPLGEVFVNLLT